MLHGTCAHFLATFQATIEDIGRICSNRIWDNMGTPVFWGLDINPLSLNSTAVFVLFQLRLDRWIAPSVRVTPPR